MKNKIVTCALFAALGSVVSIAHAAVLVDEDFSYSDGSLTVVSDGAWGAHSGAGSTPVTVSGGTVSLAQGSGSREDVNIPLGDTMGAGDTWYYAMDVSVAGGSTAVYFAMFMESTSTFAARLFVTAPVSGGDYTFGLGTGSSAAVTWGTDMTFGETYTVVVAYDFDSGDVTLWVDPVSAVSASVTLDTSFSDNIISLGLRQAGGNSIQIIDNVKVGTTFSDVVSPVPEPSAYAAILGALALAGVATRRRRA